MTHLRNRRVRNPNIRLRTKGVITRCWTQPTFLSFFSGYLLRCKCKRPGPVHRSGTTKKSAPFPLCWLARVRISIWWTTTGAIRFYVLLDACKVHIPHKVGLGTTFTCGYWVSATTARLSISRIRSFATSDMFNGQRSRLSAANIKSRYSLDVWGFPSRTNNICFRLRENIFSLDDDAPNWNLGQVCRLPHLSRVTCRAIQFSSTVIDRTPAESTRICTNSMRCNNRKSESSSCGCVSSWADHRPLSSSIKRRKFKGNDSHRIGSSVTGRQGSCDSHPRIISIPPVTHSAAYGRRRWETNSFFMIFHVTKSGRLISCQQPLT